MQPKCYISTIETKPLTQEDDLNTLPASLTDRIIRDNDCPESSENRIFFVFDSEKDYYVLHNKDISEVYLERFLSNHQLPIRILKDFLLEIKYLKAHNPTGRLHHVPCYVKPKTSDFSFGFLYVVLGMYFSGFALAVTDAYFLEETLTRTLSLVCFLVGFFLQILFVFANGKVSCFSKFEKTKVLPGKEYEFRILNVVYKYRKFFLEYNTDIKVHESARWLELVSLLT